MFSKSSILFTSALAAVAAATPTRRTDLPASDCTTGPVQCCQSTQEPGHFTDSTKALFGLLGIVVQDVTALVGLTCNPITVIGAGGSGCSASPVCCENNTFHGLVSLGCVPVDINL